MKKLISITFLAVLVSISLNTSVFASSDEPLRVPVGSGSGTWHGDRYDLRATGWAAGCGTEVVTYDVFLEESYSYDYYKAH